MSVRRLATFEHGGHDLAYEIHGHGERVVVLLHGLLLDANLNALLAQTLADAGYRVVLLDLLGHGRSDRPAHATFHRMDAYADQVLALLDELRIEEAVVGGVSLGANVALLLSAQAPDRVKALVLEMPVLEWAAPAAALTFVHMLLAVRYLGPVARGFSWLMGRLPRSGFGPLDSFMNALSSTPQEVAAVLHGLLVGPMAPRVEQRVALRMPALVIGHERDLIHPFTDARNLTRELPNSHFVQATSVLELRLRPTRLTGEILRFLEEVFDGDTSAQVVPVTSRAPRSRPRR